MVSVPLLPVLSTILFSPRLNSGLIIRWIESSRASSPVSLPPVLCPLIDFYHADSVFSKRNSDYIALLSMVPLCHQNKVRIQHGLQT